MWAQCETSAPMMDRKDEEKIKDKDNKKEQKKNQKVYLLDNGCERAGWNERAINIGLRNQGLCSEYKGWMHESRFLKKKNVCSKLWELLYCGYRDTCLIHVWCRIFFICAFIYSLFDILHGNRVQPGVVESFD